MDPEDAQFHGAEPTSFEPVNSEQVGSAALVDPYDNDPLVEAAPDAGGAGGGFDDVAMPVEAGEHSGGVTYEQAMAEIDKMDPSAAEPATAMTYEQALVEINKMPVPAPENDADRAYQAAMAQIDRLAAGENDPAGMAFGDVAVPEHAGDLLAGEGAQHGDDPAAAAADSGSGIFDDLNVPAGDSSDHLDLQTDAAPVQPTEVADQPHGEAADHLDLQTEPAVTAGQPAEVSDQTHGEPAASTEGTAAVADAAGAGVNPLDVLSAASETPSDDVNTPAVVVADEHSTANDDGHAASAAPTGRPADEPAVQSADEPVVAPAAAVDPPVGPGIGEAVAEHAIGEAPPAAGADAPAVAAAAADPSSEPTSAASVSPVAEHPVSDPLEPASNSDLHASDPASAHLADEPVAAADTGALESTEPVEPAEPAVVDVDAYETHLHELSSDQLLDEAFHQGQPELQQAALEELRHRLHGDDAPSTNEHESAADPIVAAVEEVPHEPAAAPLPEEPPSAELPTAEAPEPLSAQALETLLDEKAGATDDILEWKSSVVDLLKLCGMDSSQEAREHYAVELGFPADELGETSSAELNMWLHGQLLSTLEQNGGNLPAGLRAYA